MYLELPCRKPELTKITPHQSTMLLIEQIDAFDLEQFSINTSLSIRESSEFLDQKAKKMPVWVSFEYFAQSIAALSGISHIEKDEEPKIGFIMGVRDFCLNKSWFDINDTVTIQVFQEFREGDIAVFRGTALVNDDVYCSGNLSVIENNKELMNHWQNEFINK